MMKMKRIRDCLLIMLIGLSVWIYFDKFRDKNKTELPIKSSTGRFCALDLNSNRLLLSNNGYEWNVVTDRVKIRILTEYIMNDRSDCINDDFIVKWIPSGTFYPWI